MDEEQGVEPQAAPTTEDDRWWSEAQQALSGRLGRRPTISELAAELGWTEDRVTAVGRGSWGVTSGAGSSSSKPFGATGELRHVPRQLDQLARQVAPLVDQGSATGTLTPSPRLRAPQFPDVGPLEDVPAEHRVEMHHDHDDGRLRGTLGDEPVEWHLVRHRSVSGRMGGHGLEASWSTGDNYVPEPGGWTPGPGWVSDFPNIPADLKGSFAGADAELHGVFHLGPEYRFERGSIVGRIGAIRLEATALAASGGLSSAGTVMVEGTYGSAPFEIYATIDGGLSCGMVHGTVEAAAVHLDLRRQQLNRIVRPGLQVPRPGPGVDISGSYQGPPELLAVIVGTILQFM
ncbi:MAG: hypothetical protein M0Z42_22905 [Actinomycetota bacterium]|nr:hypothetical protein [Actinomycetota bacterium]